MKTSFLRNVVDLVTESINPSLYPDKKWKLFSLPGFDNGRQVEYLLGNEIGSIKYIVPNRCILFNKLNVRFRRIWKIDDASPNKICSTEYLPFVVKDGVSPDFVYQAIRSEAFTERLACVNTNTSGSHKRVDSDFILDSPIPLPDLPTQLQIAGILGSLDEKIELNRRKIAELEALSKTIYDYWFVQFDFPDANGRPYKSSGGKMVWNEQLKREVPTGWEVNSLNTIFAVCSGKDHKHLLDGRYPVLGSGGIMRYVTEYLYDGESVLIPRKGTLNNVMFMQTPFWTVDTMFYTRPKRTHIMKYVYMAIRDFDFESLNTGTGVPSMTASIINRILIVIPPDRLKKQIDALLGNFFSDIEILKDEIGTLTNERDILLPLLMNGQVEVAR